MITAIRYYDTSFSIYFYGCNNGTGCTSIQYFSGYRTEGSVSASRLNEWNRDKRYARAYLSDSGAARIEYDVYLGADGMSQADFDQSFSLWTRSMGEFEEFIDW
jgi:putative sensory transduction regulator